MMDYNSYIHNEIGCILQAQSIVGRLVCSRSWLSQFRVCMRPHFHTRELPASRGHSQLLFDHRAAPLEQLRARCRFKDTSAVGEQGVCFSFASLTQIFSDMLQS